jgi:hypothetical protein
MRTYCSRSANNSFAIEINQLENLIFLPWNLSIVAFLSLFFAYSL